MCRPYSPCYNYNVHSNTPPPYTHTPHTHTRTHHMHTHHTHILYRILVARKVNTQQQFPNNTRMKIDLETFLCVSGRIKVESLSICLVDEGILILLYCVFIYRHIQHTLLQMMTTSLSWTPSLDKRTVRVTTSMPPM